MAGYLIAGLFALFGFSCATPVPKPGKLIKRGEEVVPPRGYVNFKKINKIVDNHNDNDAKIKRAECIERFMRSD